MPAVLLRLMAVVAAGMCLASSGQSPAAQPPPSGGAPAGQATPSQAPAGGPRIVIDYPKDGDMVSGAVTLATRVLPPSQAVERVTFTVDNRVACVVEQAPFECAWDFGPGVKVHQVRVVAQLPGLPALRRAIRTVGSEYALGVEVDEIHMTTSVTDKSGRFVRNLGRSNFRVYENGVRQTVDFFISSNIPLELVAAVDTSGSMAEAMPRSKQAVKAFLKALRPQDRVTVLAFNQRPFTIGPPTFDLGRRLSAIDRLAPWGGTSLYETIIRGLEIQGRQKGGRRAIVLFTDGEDRNSLIPIEAAERKVETSDSVLYLIGLGQGGRVPALRAVLERFARVSGGRVFFPDRAEQLGETFSQIVDELSNQYLLGYAPKTEPRDGEWRTIRVEVDNPKYKVKTREGYRVERKGAAQ